MKITVEMLMSLYPSDHYTRERVEELWGDNESLSLTDICELDIPVADKIWACTRFLSARSCRLFACDCAESVLPIWTAQYPDDNRTAEAIWIARLYANGLATIKQLTAARAAARAAAWYASSDSASGAARAAARAAAWDAASDAARAAAWSASSDAAWAAARGAVRDAARDAAWDAERAKQLVFLRKYCEQED